MPVRQTVVAVFVALVLLGGCADGKRLAPVSRIDPTTDARPETHTVRKGDTIYSVAWEHGLDYRTLSEWNRLPHPFVIYPGKILRLRGPTNAKPGETAQAEATTTGLPDSAGVSHRVLEEEEADAGAASSVEADKGASTASATSAGSETQQEKAAALEPDRFDGGAPVNTWQWPTKGKVIGAFGRSGDKGIHLSGAHEQPIVAAADGRVVYSGTGLVGYGRLIVLKHSRHFFSAYAHNSRILVEEGEVVRGGQRIALMGSSGSNQVKLHFEIRRDGKPVDPMSYLPPRRT